MSFFFFFNDTATTEIYTLSLHDALPILAILTAASTAWERQALQTLMVSSIRASMPPSVLRSSPIPRMQRSEEHTSELQSQSNLVCRLLLEKKKQEYAMRT